MPNNTDSGTWSKHVLKELNRLADLVEKRSHDAERKFDSVGDQRLAMAERIAVVETQTAGNSAEIKTLRDNEAQAREDLNELRVTVVQKLGWGALGGGIATGVVELFKFAAKMFGG